MFHVDFSFSLADNICADLNESIFVLQPFCTVKIKKMLPFFVGFLKTFLHSLHICLFVCLF